jgi:hypothetical protein
MATTVGNGIRGRAVASRAAAIGVALWWAVLFFGVIDLLVGIIPSEYPDFSQFVVVETSWGLLYSCLVPVPLIAWALRPAGWMGPQVVAVAAAVLATGVTAAAWGQVFVSLLVAASASFPRMWQPRQHWSVGRLLVTPAIWPVVALLAIGLGGAVWHAWNALDTARSHVGDDDTWGLMHLPMQAGFALAVPAAAAVALVAMANGVSGWWFAIVPPAISAVWFGLICMRYPDLLGSIGETAGWLTVAWGIAIVVAVWTTGFWIRTVDVIHAAGSWPFESD